MIDTDELRDAVVRLLTPNWIKRRRIRPLVLEYNQLTTVRNQAYPNATPHALLEDTLNQQSGPSLDKTFEIVSDAVARLRIEVTYWRLRIAENELREERQRREEEAFHQIKNPTELRPKSAENLRDSEETWVETQ